jgi:hypothetical protein
MAVRWIAFMVLSDKSVGMGQASRTIQAVPFVP